MAWSRKDFNGFHEFTPVGSRIFFATFFTCVDVLETSKKVGGRFCTCVELMEISRQKKGKIYFFFYFFPAPFDMPAKASYSGCKKLGAGFKERRSTPEN